MKTLSNLKFMAMALFVAMLSMSLTACGDDDDNDNDNDNEVVVDENEIVGTTWSDENSSSEGDVVTTLSFNSSTAKLVFSYKSGTQTVTNTHNYSWRRSGNLVVMTPKEDGDAILEGRIESGIRMTLTNASTGMEVAILYKK